MRIKKVSQTTTTSAQIVNSYSDSQTNGYSCDYVNGQLSNIIDAEVLSTTEVKTNKVWIDGKPIYRKVVPIVINSRTDIREDYNISNADTMWVDEANTFILNASQSITANYYYSSSDYARVWINVNEGKIRFTTSTTFSDRTLYVTILYTKTTDVVSS